MVVLVTVSVLAPMYWLRAADDVTARRRQFLSAGAIAAAVPLCAVALYAWLGRPDALAAGPAATAALPPAHAAAAAAAADMTGSPAASGAGATAGDLGEAVARLEARLARSPDDPSGWELLAQSYEFAGRTADAAAARQRRLPAGAGQAPAPVSAPASAAMLGATLPATSGAANAGATNKDSATAPQAPNAAAVAATAARLPSDLDKLVIEAQQARRARDFPRALAAFAALAKRNALDASLWADYADATAAQRGRLDEASEPLIRRALALDPQHPKALWLLGSLQVQRRDYASALQTWLAMQKVMPANSPDAKLIAENVAEARAMLAGGQPGAGAAPPAASLAAAGASLAAKGAAPSTGGVALRGDIDLDARWRGKVPADTVLYVFAKAVGQPGPPVAVLRTTAARWPQSFVLDDSLAMMPGRNLSGASSVIVEARLSRSGSANPQPGDLRGTSAALDPRRAGPLRIVIAEEIS